MNEKLVKCHQGCAEMHERVARWMKLEGESPDVKAETIGLISDMEIMIHATTHEIEVCLHDEHYFPRLDWLTELRHVAAMFTALAVGTKKFEDHLRHTVECDHEMANGRDCVCGVTHLRNEMRTWIEKNEKALSTNRFDIMKSNLVERRAMDVAICESKHKIDTKENIVDVYADQYHGRVKRMRLRDPLKDTLYAEDGEMCRTYSKGHAATCMCTWCSSQREDETDAEVARSVLKGIAAHPDTLVTGDELARRLRDMEED